MSGYSNYTNPPVTYLEWAESALLSIDNSKLGPHGTVNYAQALIALASAQMTGRSRV